MNELEAKITILSQETEHVNKSIHFRLSSIYGTLGFVLPAITAIFAYFFKSSSVDHPELIVFILITILSLISLHLSTIWLDMFRFAIYKYTVLLPRMYSLSNQCKEENHGQFFFRTKQHIEGYPLLAFNCLLTTILLVLAYHGIYKTEEELSLLLFITSLAMILASTVGAFITFRFAYKTQDLVTASSPTTDQERIL